MALRQKLSPPFTVEAAADQNHTHTVVFLHRFPEATTDEELPSKVLSSKLTRNHKSLAEQFPSVRWVFPYAKLGARPYGNLTAEDKAAVGLLPAGSPGSSAPYVTQVVLQEAERLGGLDKVILGGQGETAVAAHDAMGSFPGVSAALMRENSEDAIADFIRKTFHNASWTDASQPRLAAFVAMHADDGVVTRDVADYGIATKTPNDPPKVNTSVMINTPHRFIRGGYKVKTATWDGRRIDDLAAFLEADLAIFRVPEEPKPASSETLIPKDRNPQEEEVEKKEELNDVQKYAQSLAEDKKANSALRDKIMLRIEADKVERKIRQARERQRRLHAPADPDNSDNPARDPVETEIQARQRETEARIRSGNIDIGSSGNSSPRPGAGPSARPYYASIPYHPDEDADNVEPEGFHQQSGSESDRSRNQRPKKKLRKTKSGRRKTGRRADEGGSWQSQRPEGRGQLTEAQMKAFGLSKDDEEGAATSSDDNEDIKVKPEDD